ncbi:barstar family protein [Burkholderia stagnalis]|uniref:barstar family protein n=1 Tax=Burkholderia stagnalis TaxID=1503054 RepID=UPI0009C09E84|nr:barstar family protein [Burkholderia stagnalis]
MGASDVFTFVPESRDFMEDDAFVARISVKICTEQQLFESFFRLLAFPEYFGFNWNALFDCLRDFHWIYERGIVIVHDELPELSDVEMRIYFEILHDAVVDWKPGEAHSLKVVFNNRDRARVEAACEL